MRIQVKGDGKVKTGETQVYILKRAASLKEFMAPV